MEIAGLVQLLQTIYGSNFKVKGIFIFMSIGPDYLRTRILLIQI